MMKKVDVATPSIGTNSHSSTMYYPMITACIFVPLAMAFFLGGNGPELDGQELPLAFGILAYALVLAEVLFSARPRFLERKTGLMQLYAVHGIMALALLVMETLWTP